jgi:hypothetical protein
MNICLEWMVASADAQKSEMYLQSRARRSQIRCTVGKYSRHLQEFYGSVIRPPQQISREQWRSICETSVRPEKSVCRKLSARAFGPRPTLLYGIPDK